MYYRSLATAVPTQTDMVTTKVSLELTAPDRASLSRANVLNAVVASMQGVKLDDLYDYTLKGTCASRRRRATEKVLEELHFD